MVIGGGGVGESEKSSEKTRLVDLKDRQPALQGRRRRWTKGTRYPSSLDPAGRHACWSPAAPADYRGRGDSNVLEARAVRPEDRTRTRGSPIRWWAATTTPGRCCCPTAG